MAVRNKFKKSILETWEKLFTNENLQSIFEISLQEKLKNSLYCFCLTYLWWITLWKVIKFYTCQYSVHMATGVYNLLTFHSHAIILCISNKHTLTQQN